MSEIMTCLIAYPPVTSVPGTVTVVVESSVLVGMVTSASVDPAVVAGGGVLSASVEVVVGS